MTAVVGTGGRPRGGGLKSRGGWNIAGGAAGLAVGVATGSTILRPGATAN